MHKLVVLISGGGSNLKALIDASQEPGFPAEIVAVGADNDASGLDYAVAAGIDTFVERPADFSNRAAWGDALLTDIQRYRPDLVVSAGFMRILPENIVHALSPRIINTHPSLLPLFPGAHAVRDALAAGADETGVTVHVIDAGVDTGPILRQARVAVERGDTVDALHERIKTVERPLLVETVHEIADGTIDLTTIPTGGPTKE